MISWMLIDVARMLIGVLMELWWTETKSLHLYVIWLQLCSFMLAWLPLISVCYIWWSKKKKEFIQDHSVVIYEHWHVSDQIFFCRLFAHMYTMIPFIFYIIAANFSSMLFVVCKLFYEHNVLPVWIHFILVKKTILIHNQAKWQALVNAAMNLLIS